MLVLGSRLMGTPVMSLQTGGRLARATRPLIDPGTLAIYAYELDGPLLAERPSFLRVAEIRETSGVGMIVDSTDDFVGLHDVIKIEELEDLKFPLVGMKVIDEQRRRLGKVLDYTLETGSFVIQQLHVQRGVLRAIADTGLLIHRSQIVEINDENIVVKANTAEEGHPTPADLLPKNYINPFRNPAPAPKQHRD